MNGQIKTETGSRRIKNIFSVPGARADAKHFRRIQGAGDFRLRDLSGNSGVVGQGPIDDHFLVGRFGGRPYWDLIEIGICERPRPPAGQL